jgi:MYXO-CTERM domain-containing protein
LATDTAMDSLPLPADLTPGNYWLGFCVNYDSSTATFGGNEITTVNDCLGSSAPVTVSTGTLAVIAPTLPMVTQFAAFGLRLQAAGGSGQYTWQVSGGALPAGVTLSAAGDLGGTPTSAGSFSFDVKVTSGTLTDTKSLSLTVSAGNLPLVLVDQVLTSPQFGLPYQASLIAVVGKPPYTWVVTDLTTLPAGLALASDGTLEGRATQAGSFSFPVQVTDSAGAMAAKQLSMKVVNPSALAIATTALPAAHLNRNYQQALVAVGGRAPYSWSVVRVQQLPQNPTEFPQPEVVGAAVTPFLANLGLTIDAAKGLIGKPLVAGLFSLTLQVNDGSGTVDHSTVLLQVTYDSALVITTTSLPDAYFDEPYANVKLAHNGGVDARGIAFSTPCVELGVHPGSFTCAPADPSQQLPPGLILANDGTISGTANGGLGTYTFLVKLTDASGRQDVRALSIRVNGDFAAQKSGCAGAPASPSLLALVALVALASRRRR